MHLAQRAYVLIAAHGRAGDRRHLVERAGARARCGACRRRCCCSDSLSRRRYLRRPAHHCAAVETAPRALLGRASSRSAFAFRNERRASADARVRTRVPAGLRAVDRARRRVAPAARARLCAMRCRCCRCGSGHNRGRCCRRACSVRWRSPGGRALCSRPSSWRWRRIRCAGRGATARNPGGRGRGVSSAPAPSCISCAARPRRPAGADRLEGDRARRQLVTREFSEDQHLDILVAIDAGRLQPRARRQPRPLRPLCQCRGALCGDRHAPNDDRIGLMVYADRPLATCAPARGLAAVTRMRRTLEELAVESGRVRSRPPRRSRIRALAAASRSGRAAHRPRRRERRRALARAVRPAVPASPGGGRRRAVGEIGALARARRGTGRIRGSRWRRSEHEARAAGQRAAAAPPRRAGHRGPRGAAGAGGVRGVRGAAPHAARLTARPRRARGRTASPTAARP